MADIKMTYQVNPAVPPIIDILQSRIPPALGAVGTQAQAHATANITANGTVDTDRLRSSIVFEVEGDTVAIGTNVNYAPYIEFGTGIYAEQGGGRQTPWVYQNSRGEWVTTRGAHPHPFLRPAIEENIEEYRQILEKILKG